MAPRFFPEDDGDAGPGCWIAGVLLQQGDMKPKWLLIIGVILMIVGTAWFLQSVEMGGGYGSILAVLAGRVRGP